MEAEVRLLLPLQSAPVFQRGIEQAERADDIGLDEGARPVDRAVDMAFGRQVHDPVDPLFAQQGQHQLAIEDIAFDQPVVGGVCDHLQAFGVAGIGQLVEIDHALAVAHQLAHHRRADEARTAGDEDRVHRAQPS